MASSTATSKMDDDNSDTNVEFQRRSKTISFFYQYCPALLALSLFGFPFHTLSKCQTATKSSATFRIVLILFRLVLLMILVLMTLWATYVVFLLLSGTKKGIGYSVFVLCNLYNALVAFYVIWTTEHTFVAFLDGVARHWQRFLTSAQKLTAGRRLRQSNLTYFSLSLPIIVAAIVISSFVDRPSSTRSFLASYNSSLAESINATMYARLQPDGLRAPMPYFTMVEVFNLLVLLLEIHVCKMLQICFELAASDGYEDAAETARKKLEMGAGHYYYNLMLRFKNCHESTVKLVMVADTMFSKVIFAWAGGVLISCCCIVYSLKNTPFELYQVAIMALLLMHVIYFAVLVFQAAEVNDKVTQVADHLKGCLDVVQNHEFNDDFRVGIIFTAFYMARMNIVPQGLTAFGVIVVRRDFILTIFGTALTYSIIVYDLN